MHKPKFSHFVLFNSSIVYKEISRHSYVCKRCGKRICANENQKTQIIINWIINLLTFSSVPFTLSFIKTKLDYSIWNIIPILAFVLYGAWLICVNVIFYNLRNFKQLD